MILKKIDFIFILVIAFSLTLYFNYFPLNTDSTWILHCAEKITNGFTMYKDMIDVNPPLIFIYSTIPIYMSKFLPFSTHTFYILFILLLIIISTVLSFNILKKIPYNSKKSFKLLIYSLVFILTIAIITNFGQREHLLMIFIFPYILLMMHKDNIELSTVLKISISIFASLGFNLKPHFFFIFICIELIYLLHSKKISSVFRIETIIISSSLLVYIIVIYTYFFEYIDFMIPFALEAYIHIFNLPFNVLFINYEITLFIVIIIYFLIFEKDKFSLQNKVILISILSSIILYLLQQKGWSYHRVPILTQSLFFLFYILYKNKESIYSIVFIPFIIVNIYYNFSTYSYPKPLKKYLANLPYSNTIHIVSLDIDEGVTVLKDGQTWGSRFPSLFMVPAILERNESVKNYMFNALKEDILIYKPDKIIFLNKEFYQNFISKDISLKEIYEEYYTMKEKDQFLILTKQKEFK